MTEPRKPPVPAYKKHIFVCTGTRCAPDTSNSVYQYLKNRLKELKLNQGDDRVHRAQCQCLGICEGGPLAVVYPEGIWYCHLDQEKMERVIQEHLIQGKPVPEYMLYDLGKDKK